MIQAEGLSKYYRLGVINNGTLFKDLQTWIARKLGKEDPHSRIGDKYDGTADGFWALKNLNFEIKQGDRVGIIGKNGAGKSTLLKILSRITAPTEGKVKIRGRVASLLEVGTGFHGELTGRENIYLNGAILGMKKKEVDRKLDEIIDFSGIEKYIDTPVKRYSSGMYVRLAFAVAAHLDSEILIADEVLAVGDAEFQKKALGKMNELSMGEGRTVLFVSHNIAAVKQLCNRGILLEKGKIKQAGKLDDVIDSYIFSSSASTYIDMRNYKPDFSDNTIAVTAFYVPDYKKKNKLLYNKNEKIIFNIDIISTEKKRIVLPISIANQSEILVCVRHEEPYYEIEARKKYTISVEIENMFLSGCYTVHFGIDVGGENIWWGTDVCTFEVYRDNPKKLSGFFEIKSCFSCVEV